MTAFSFLSSLDLISLIGLFWYTAILDVPRYTISAIVAVGIALWAPSRRSTTPLFKFSVLLVGHNEERSLPACVNSLWEQTIAREPGRMQVVVVDDGSTDAMADVAYRLQRLGKINEFFRLQQRGGKSAGVNLAIGAAVGEIVIIADIDTTFDRDAFEIILGYFDDPSVGAVSGNLGVRNASTNLITRHQAIEYAIGISLGRRILDALGILPIVSGAFGAFRRTALEDVGRQDVEVGEDADLTMKLRRAGWRVRFATDARGLTHVPTTLPALTAQRLRWDRGLITIWSRKFRTALDPRHSMFRLIDALAIADVVVFQIVLAVAFPIYAAWLLYYFGAFGLTIIGATLIAYAALDVVAFLTVASVEAGEPLRLLLYVPLYTAMQISVMRAIRIFAIGQELILRSSYRDPYVPERVMRTVERV
jgi:cellulose synthase/poly-beta-1,6-N-acetylglucosamine synthase-like glycosyltransferase